MVHLAGWRLDLRSSTIIGYPGRCCRRSVAGERADTTRSSVLLCGWFSGQRLAHRKNNPEPNPSIAQRTGEDDDLWQTFSSDGLAVDAAFLSPVIPGSHHSFHKTCPLLPHHYMPGSYVSRRGLYCSSRQPNSFEPKDSLRTPTYPQPCNQPWTSCRCQGSPPASKHSSQPSRPAFQLEGGTERDRPPLDRGWRRGLE